MFLCFCHKWVDYFGSCKQDCLPINAHSRSSVQKLLELVELKLKEKIANEPTLLVMVVGVPNVGKSALINCIHQIASTRFPEQEKKKKRAKVGPLPGVTQDIAGFKIAQRPSIYVLDTPGVLVPTREQWQHGNVLELKDPTLKSSCVVQQFRRTVQVALLCVQESAKDRPTTSDMVSMLLNETVALPTPKRPPSVTCRADSNSTSAGENKPEDSSVNDMTITHLDVRRV